MNGCFDLFQVCILPLLVHRIFSTTQIQLRAIHDPKFIFIFIKITGFIFTTQWWAFAISFHNLTYNLNSEMLKNMANLNIKPSKDTLERISFKLKESENTVIFADLLNVLNKQRWIEINTISHNSYLFVFTSWCSVIINTNCIFMFLFFCSSGSVLQCDCCFFMIINS